MRIHFKPYASSQRIAPVNFPINIGVRQDLSTLFGDQTKYLINGTHKDTQYLLSSDTYREINKLIPTEALPNVPDRLKNLLDDDEVTAIIEKAKEAKSWEPIFKKDHENIISRRGVSYWRTTVDEKVVRMLRNAESQEIGAGIDILKNGEEYYTTLDKKGEPVYDKHYVELALFDEINARYPLLTDPEKITLMSHIEKGEWTSIGDMFNEKDVPSRVRVDHPKVDLVIDSSIKSLDEISFDTDKVNMIVVTHSDIEGIAEINQELIRR